LGFCPPSLEEVDRSFMAIKRFIRFFLFLYICMSNGHANNNDNHLSGCI
jgi:hypothetical protein